MYIVRTAYKILSIYFWCDAYTYLTSSSAVSSLLQQRKSSGDMSLLLWTYIIPHSTVDPFSITCVILSWSDLEFAIISQAETVTRLPVLINRISCQTCSLSFSATIWDEQAQRFSADSCGHPQHREWPKNIHWMSVIISYLLMWQKYQNNECAWMRNIMTLQYQISEHSLQYYGVLRLDKAGYVRIIHNLNIHR